MIYHYLNTFEYNDKYVPEMECRPNKIFRDNNMIHGAYLFFLVSFKCALQLKVQFYRHSNM